MEHPAKDSFRGTGSGGGLEPKQTLRRHPHRPKMGGRTVRTAGEDSRDVGSHFTLFTGLTQASYGAGEHWPTRFNEHGPVHARHPLRGNKDVQWV